VKSDLTCRDQLNTFHGHELDQLMGHQHQQSQPLSAVFPANNIANQHVTNMFTLYIWQQKQLPYHTCTTTTIYF